MEVEFKINQFTAVIGHFILRYCHTTDLTLLERVARVVMKIRKKNPH